MFFSCSEKNGIISLLSFFFSFSLFIVINVFSFLFVFLHVRLNALRIPQKSDVNIYDNYRTIYYPSIDILIHVVFFFVIKQKLYKIYKNFVNTRHVTVERHNCAMCNAYSKYTYSLRLRGMLVTCETLNTYEPHSIDFRLFH